MKKLFELVGVIRVDGLTNAVKHVSDFEKSVKKSLAPIERYGKQLQGIGKNLATSLTLPLALAGGAVLKFGGDFEDAMTNSLSIMGNVNEQMRSQMEGVAMDLSEKLPYSSEKAAEAYFFLASAGKTVEQSMALLPKVAEFATAGNFDLALATDLLTDAQSALGLSSKDVAKDQENMVRLSDVLVKANVLANASVEQFSTSLTNKAGAALKVLNKDVEEGVAVLAAYADQGVKGEKAGEQLAIVLRDLQKAALNNKDAFAAASIEVYDSAGNMNNMGDIIGDLENRLSGMSDEQKRAELTMLGFNDKSLMALITLLGTSDAIKRYETELRKAGGTTEEVSGKQMESVNKQIEILKNKVINAAISLSKSLIPVVKDQVIPFLDGMVEKIKAAVTWFTNLPEGLQNTIFGFTALVAALGPALILTGKLIASVKLITTVVTGAKLAMVAFNSTLAISPIGLVVVGVVAMGVAVNELTKRMKTATEEHSKIVSIMSEEKAKRKELTDGIENLKQKVKEATATIKDEATLNEMFGGSVEELTVKAKELGFAIDGSVSKKFESLIVIQDELNGVVDASTGLVTKYTAATKDDIDATTEKTEKTLEQIEAEKKLRDERESFVNSYQSRIESLVLTEMEQLELEEKRAMESAEKLKLSEAEKEEIQAYYTIARFELQNEMDLAAVESKREAALSEEQIAQEAYEKRLVQIEQEKEAERKKWDAIKSFAGAVVTGIASIYSMYTSNRIAEIDGELAKEKEAIEASKLSEEEKQAKFEELDEKAAKKKKELQIKQAKANKANAITDAITSTYQAAAKALNAGPFLGPIMAGILTALGLAKVGFIAAQPLPQLAEGALIKQSQGGTAVVVGEGRDDETVLPMRKGAIAIADRIMENLSATIFPAYNRPAMAMPGGGSVAMRPIEQHIHFGTVITTKGGLKELERKLYEVRAGENTRRGE